MIHHLTSLPRTPNPFNHKLSTIKGLAKANSIKDNIVRKKQIARVILASTTHHPRLTTDRKWMSILFFGKLSFKMSKT